ncbi:MAG TPA: cytochrome c peroxidase [Burkholderiales bacterium]|jgi:cytochrome c peroxidase|nr:cytochrome c peroxidase [Burkholderiales bacterium]
MLTRAAALLSGALATLAAVAADEVQFTAAERRAILAHGPWPTPLTTDPTNRASGRGAAVELGERLFFDNRLSASGRFSCATCHVPERNWTDNKVRGLAAAEVDRNTPTLMNVRLGRWYGWDGGADSLWSQSIRPILDMRELGATAHDVAELMRKDEELSCRYRRAFGEMPSRIDDEEVLVNVAKTLAAFQETFESPPTPFDRFRNALARGERSQAGTYSEAAQRGLKIFVGKGNCASCHSGPNFTNGEFANNGFSVDPGRPEGLKRARASRFNLAGRYNDDPLKAVRAMEAPEAGAFKVPTLRHLMLTAPYGHDGKRETLAEVVRHYSEKGSAVLPALKLTAAEQTDLVVFLESISTLSNPWRPSEDHNRCH